MIGNLTSQAYPKLAEDCKKTLQRFYAGEINDKEFDIEICEISCDNTECIKDFRWRPLPTKTPDFSKWRFLSEDEKNTLKRGNPTYYQDKIHSHIESVERIENLNSRNKNQLIKWIKLNISKKSKILMEEMLNTYSGR